MDGVDREDLNRLVGFGRAFCNLDRTSFELGGLITHDSCDTITEFTDKITQHYTRAAMSQFLHFVFGAEILGSPISLVSNLGTGVKDFFTEPAQGFTRSPAEFGVGIAKGTSSLIKNTTVGIFNTTSKFTGAIASGTAALTFDDKYQLERDKTRVKEKPKHAGQGLRFGAKSFGKGLFHGVTGIVTQPIQGGREQGISGAFKGIGKGVAGAVVKPTVGAIDSVSKVTEGIKNTAMLWDEEEKKKKRLPRFIGSDKAIHEYNEMKAKGQQLLRSIDNGAYKDEWFQSYYRVKDGTLLSTDKHVMMLNDNNGVEWTAPLTLIRGTQLTKFYIIVYLKRKNKEKFYQKSTAAKLIYPSQRSSSKSLEEVYTELTNFIQLLKNDRRYHQVE